MQSELTGLQLYKQYRFIGLMETALEQISTFLSWEISAWSYRNFRLHRLRYIPKVVLVFHVSFFIYRYRIQVELNASNQSNSVDVKLT